MATETERRSNGKPPTGEQGVTSEQAWIYGMPGGMADYNPDDITIAKYDRMIQVDPTVRAALRFMKLACLRRVGQYVNGDSEEIEQFVTQVMERMEGSLSQALHGVMTALDYGFSVTEKVWVPSGGQWVIRKMKTLPPATLTPKGIVTDGKGNITKVIQNQGSGSEVVFDKPKQKLIVWQYDREFGNVWGRSMLRAAYRAWFIKDAALKWWGVRLERFGQPFLVVHVPEGEDINPDTGLQEPNVTIAKKQYSNITARTVFIHSKGMDEASKWEVQLLGPEGSVRNEYQDAIRYLDTEIMRAMLMPSLLIIEPEHSSRAQAEINLDVFDLASDAILNDFVDTVMIEQLVRPLIEPNFGPDASVGAWTKLPLSPDDRNKVAAMFKDAVGFNSLSTSVRGDLDYIRKELGFPPATEEMPPVAVTPPVPTGATNPEQP